MNKKIGLFLTSQAISLFGSSLVQYAIIWYITLKTGSGVMMMISTLCGFIPQVLISLFAGVWADNYNKKKIIMIADFSIALSTLLIAILFFLGINHIWLLFVVLSIRSIGSGIQTPTINSFIPKLVKEDQLMKVNGINTTIQSIMLIISPAVSGALLASVPLEYIFFIDVVTAIIGISLLSLVKDNYKKPENIKLNYFSSIKDGITYTKNHKLIKRLLIYLAVVNVLITPLAILTPLLVTRTFGATPFYLTMNEIFFFVGNILGGILISIWPGFKNKIKTICLGSFICGFLAIILGLPFNFVFYLICMSLIGITMPLFNTPFITIFQERISPSMQGRVFSLVSIISGVIMPISMLLYGPLSDHIKIEYILIVTGIIIVIGTLFLLFDKVIEKEMIETNE